MDETIDFSIFEENSSKYCTAVERVKLEILKNNKEINLSFIKGCISIVKDHAQEFKSCKNDNERQELLKKLWLTVYKAEIESNNIIFNNKSDMIMFIIKNEV
jgi:hypothetical protein